MAPAQGSILVTGATGGLGSAIVSQIASTQPGKDYHGIYTVRERNDSRLAQILKRAPHHGHELLPLNLASLASVREAASSINKRVAAKEIPPIRALILNAGYQDYEKLNKNEDGIEMSFQVNYLSHFLLTLLLLQSMDTAQGRIVIISSASHKSANPVFPPVCRHELSSPDG